ncbi:uncharacterized protein B0H64DRAFT_5474 [Chaetomium fimeti]|uniref:Uncharacterized protein n=1 Tax=Chaetomium fimeti TaxID=1854472 RepID=A0AAE0HP03_9PEZI|nr:hypothetical protein B0H64DRAFT_5474 [Chaetomium fimeti]
MPDEGKANIATVRMHPGAHHIGPSGLSGPPLLFDSRGRLAHTGDDGRQIGHNLEMCFVHLSQPRGYSTPSLGRIDRISRGLSTDDARRPCSAASPVDCWAGPRTRLLRIDAGSRKGTLFESPTGPRKEPECCGRVAVRLVPADRITSRIRPGITYEPDAAKGNVL